MAADGARAIEISMKHLRLGAWSLASVLAIACGQPSTPTRSTIVPTPLITGPHILLAGQSNAISLYECCMPDAVAILSVSSVNFWQASAGFANAARHPNVIALVWWQGGGDILTGFDDYVTRLRDVIRIARVAHPQLPVRIVELADLADRTTVRAAQRLVAADPGVELIPTSDLQLIDDFGHFDVASYRTVRDRIYQSLGR